MVRMLVCGGRDYTDWHKMQTYVQNSWSGTPRDTITVISGGAIGADFLIKCVVQYMNEQLGWKLGFKEYPADWKKYGRGAGPIRNQQMLDEGKPNLVVAFPGGRGTADMVARAKKAGVKVIEID